MKPIHIIRKLALPCAFIAAGMSTASFGAGVLPIDPSTTVTATMDAGTGLSGNTWYEVGVNGAAPTTGLQTGLVYGQTDTNSSYFFRPAEGYNVLMLDSATPSGSIEFTSPEQLYAFSLAASDGNGSATLKFVLNFVDGTSDSITNKITVGDWFNNTNIVQTTLGRISVSSPSAWNNVGGTLASGNPRVLAINVPVPAADQTNPIVSIDLFFTGSGSSTHTAIFGVSGDATGSGHYSPIILDPSNFNQDIVVGLSEVNQNLFVQQNLVSDLTNTVPKALLQDTNLVNPWGVAFSASGPLWVSDNGTGLSTVYSTTGIVSSVVVTIPTAAGGTGGLGHPTGIVYNGTTNFVVGTNGPAHFIFATEDGTISAWTGGSAATLEADNSKAGANYTGLALGTVGTNGATNFLYAANFGAGTVDVFDTTFAQVSSGFPLITNAFSDTNLPAGFAPYNIQAFGSKLYVTYALQSTNRPSSVAGPGYGYLNVFDVTGKLLKRVITSTNGPLNAPWGLAMVPSNEGVFAGDLLVGNFGNGTIQAFDGALGTYLGPVLGTNATAVSIPGLWALTFGNGGSAGAPNTLYFTAGIPGTNTIQSHGLLGSFQLAAAQQTGVPWEFHQTVNGYQDNFSAATRNTNWVAVGNGDATPDQYVQTERVLRVFPSLGDPNHLLYQAPGYSTNVQEVLARIRVIGFQTNNDGPRGGIGVGVLTTNTANPSRGVDLEIRDYKTDSNDTNLSQRKFKFLYDGVSWGPQGLMSGTNEVAWTNNTWYWMRLRQDSKADGVNDLFGKVWLADGATPEPASWQMVWNYSPAHPISAGFAGITGASGSGFAQFEISYILIKAAGLPAIQPDFFLAGPPSFDPLFTGTSLTNTTASIQWFGGSMLQSSTNVLGPYTTLPYPSSGTYSPYSVSVAAPGQKFYRIQR